MCVLRRRLRYLIPAYVGGLGWRFPGLLSGLQRLAGERWGRQGWWVRSMKTESWMGVEAYVVRFFVRSLRKSACALSLRLRT